MLEKIEGRKRRGWQRTRRLDGITDSIDVSLRKLWEMVKDQQDWHASPWGHKESDTTEWLNSNNFLRFTCCSLCQNSLPFHGWIIFYCVGRPHFIYPFICWWTFWLLWTMLLHVTWCTNISLKPCFQYIPTSIIPRPFGNPIFNFLRSHWLVFLLHQQCTGIPVSPHPCQHLLVFKIKNVCLSLLAEPGLMLLCAGSSL